MKTPFFMATLLAALLILAASEREATPAPTPSPGTTPAAVASINPSEVGGQRSLDPIVPAEAFFVSGDFDYVADVFVSGDLAYVAAYESGLQIVDVSDPTAPVEVGSLVSPRVPVVSRAEDFLDTARGVFVSGGLAFVAFTYSGLQIVDVSDPTAPVEVGSLVSPRVPVVSRAEDFLDTARGVFVSGGLAFVAFTYSGLQIVDVSDPTAPVEVGSLVSPRVPVVSRAEDFLDTARGVFVSGGLAFVAFTYSGLQIVDVSDPTAPVEVGSLDASDLTLDVFVSGDLAYVAAYESGLQIVDVSDPTAPVEVGALDTPDSALDVFVSGGLAFVADDRGDLRIVDVSNPRAPVEVGAWDSTGRISGVFVSGGLAFVASGHDGLRIMDVSDPAAPVEVGAFHGPGRQALVVFVSGDLAFVGNHLGLRVVDVSDPTAPVEVGALTTAVEPDQPITSRGTTPLIGPSTGLFVGVLLVVLLPVVAYLRVRHRMSMDARGRRLVPAVIALAGLLGYLAGLISGVLSGLSTAFNGNTDAEIAAAGRAAELFFGVSAVSLVAMLGVILRQTIGKVTVATMLAAAVGILTLVLMALNAGNNTPLIIIGLLPVVLFFLAGWLTAWQVTVHGP